MFAAMGACQWIDPQWAVAFPKSERSGDIIAVGRVLHDAGIYPAKHRRFPPFDFRAAINNRRFKSADGEVLMLGSGCLTAWVTYSVPNALPVGAVAGGYVGEGVLYVARAVILDKYSIGYFTKETKLGYFTGRRVVVTTDTMEILVAL